MAPRRSARGRGAREWLGEPTAELVAAVEEKQRFIGEPCGTAGRPITRRGIAIRSAARRRARRASTRSRARWTWPASPPSPGYLEHRRAHVAGDVPLREPAARALHGDRLPRGPGAMLVTERDRGRCSPSRSGMTRSSEPSGGRAGPVPQRADRDALRQRRRPLPATRVEIGAAQRASGRVRRDALTALGTESRVHGSRIGPHGVSQVNGASELPERPTVDSAQRGSRGRR